MKTALIIPTLNAGSKWKKVLAAIDEQVLQPERKILLDSGSKDATAKLAEEHGFEIQTISAEEFNHGLTRQTGVDLCPDMDLLIFMTQDAMPVNSQAFEQLLKPFNDAQTGVAYGRQIPLPGTPPVETFARRHNYPPTSRIKTLADIPALGLQTAFCSNSFAAWKRSTLQEIGGFPPTVFGEDMLAAANLILAGHSVAYCTEASVFHAHPLSLREIFRRGQQIGMLHRNHPWLRKQFGSPQKAGSGYIHSGMRYLTRKSPQKIPPFLFQSAIKLLGFLSGKSGVC